MVLVMLQMLLVGSIASDVRIGLIERNDGLGITGKVDVFHFFSLTFFSKLTALLHTKYGHYQVLK